MSTSATGGPVPSASGTGETGRPAPDDQGAGRLNSDGPDSAGSALGAGRSLLSRAEEYVIGALVAGLGVFVLVDTATIAVPGSANAMGPRTFPYVVGALLVGAGVAVLVATARGRVGAAEDGEDVDPNAGTDWRTVVLLVAVFLAHAWLIERAGWPLAVAVLFAGAAWTLGARPWWRPVVVGVLLGLLLQVVFGTGLGLSLPAGWLEGVPVIDG
ncbi:tripartite tricarboxylate transporter TctB family protein [Jiangella alkaliphila]|uniref:Putative tricarboxylic transport membrane protein n=1 Tax=Jiangella alkaliphila TaxID=419479 RepID=A0A1H2KH01_9ACTN|nr:tripartite tricarboxylate transporter TctB family protein [Jiangella alkaliphila]SDU67990.1 putative tricarboxylic transport membrane protein [Jiangella alkaliphila]